MKKFPNELYEFLKIESISDDSRFADKVKKCASFVEDLLTKFGVENVSQLSTKNAKGEGFPVVYGEKTINKNLPTVLYYAHYDVQPHNDWEEAFSPIERITNVHPEGAIFARGSADDKGQLIMFLIAFKKMLDKNELPCNLKFLIEGEEEIGSTCLENCIKENLGLFACNTVIVCDSPIINKSTPSILVGVRGISRMKVEVIGPSKDLHSGEWGGYVPNPANILCKIIGSIQDEDFRITIPSFYDSVLELTKEDRDKIVNSIPNFDDNRSQVGITEWIGEKEYKAIERKTIRPTFDVNGLTSGTSGAIIPNKAVAYISFRLVPNQQSEFITAIVTEYIEGFKKKYPVTINVTPSSGAEPIVSSVDSKEYKAAEEALKKTFNVSEVIPTREGGSLPAWLFLSKYLQVNCILMGFGLSTDNGHSKDEHFGFYNFQKGVDAIPRFFKNYAKSFSDK